MRTARRLGLALVVAVGCLGLVEGAIRATSVVKSDTLPSPLGFQKLRRKIWKEGSTAESVVYLGGRPREVLVERTGLRVVVLGGSAVHGERHTPFSAFTGQMDRYLNRAFDVPVEVINLGESGIGLRHVHRILEMVLEQEHPDLVIVYSGNNEFHEVRVLKTIDPEFDSRVWLTRRSLFRFHLYRLLRRIIAATIDIDPVHQPQGSYNLYELETTVDDDDRALVEWLYRKELEKIVGIVEQAGVPLLLSTVADNLRWPQLPSECPAYQEQERLNEEQRQLLDELNAPDSEARVIPIGIFLEDRAALHSSPRALCMVGNMLADAGRFTEAGPILERAEYFAPRPFRSNVVQRETVRVVAREAEVAMCDVSAALSQWSPGRIPGWDVFDDTCHPNALGHARIGGILARCILEQGLLGTRGDPGVRAELEQIGAGRPAGNLDPIETDPKLRWKIGHLGEDGPAGNVFRLDLWRGARDPTTIGKVVPPSDDSPEATAAAGHLAFVAKQNALAIDYYRLAIARGGPELDLRVSEALVRLYMGDLVAARVGLDQALADLGEEAYLRDLRATLGP